MIFKVDTTQATQKRNYKKRFISYSVNLLEVVTNHVIKQKVFNFFNVNLY